MFFHGMLVAKNTKPKLYMIRSCAAVNFAFLLSHDCVMLDDPSSNIRMRDCTISPFICAKEENAQKTLKKNNIASFNRMKDTDVTNLH
jgi:hypothetical protein